MSDLSEDEVCKVRPILFSAPMVRALLDGSKTQTRRIVKPAPGLQSQWLTSEGICSVPHGEMIDGGWQMHHPRAGTTYMGVAVEYASPFGWVRCPYGVPGDRLWVRETWAVPHRYDGHGPSNIPVLDVRTHYAASEDRGGLRWRPSIHMPRWASRIALEVTGVRVERLQEISEADAKAEGVDLKGFRSLTEGIAGREHRIEYRTLWESINGTGSWDANPWVWVVEFKRIAP